MIQKKNGLNDSDKVLVTVALWISAVTLFATALSLPMLPDKVTIFYQPDAVSVKFYSKYNNLFIILVSVIPAAIVLICAMLKKRNRLQNNFLSIILFSIMLSICIGSVIIYGIMQQFDASSTVKTVSVHGLITILASFVLSMTSAFMPMILNAQGEPKSQSDIKRRLSQTAKEYWNIGAYGFLLGAVASSFTPDYYCYIPFAVVLVAYAVVMLILTKKHTKTADAQ